MIDLPNSWSRAQRRDFIERIADGDIPREVVIGDDVVRAQLGGVTCTWVRDDWDRFVETVKYMYGTKR